MTFETIRAIALELPGTVEATSRGIHSFTVRRKLFLRLMEDGRTLVLRTDPYERDHLLSTAPAVFHVTSQIRDHPGSSSGSRRPLRRSSPGWCGTHGGAWPRAGW